MRERATIGFLTSDWMAKWRAFFSQLGSEAIKKQSIDPQVETASLLGSGDECNLRSIHLIKKTAGIQPRVSYDTVSVLFSLFLLSGRLNVDFEAQCLMKMSEQILTKRTFCCTHSNSIANMLLDQR